MSQQELDSRKLLTAFVNALHKGFIESSRDDAKNRFKTMLSGDVISLLRVSFEDGSYLESELALNQAEFRGNLNFSAFIQSLAALMREIVDLLENEKDIATLASEDGLETLFKIVGFSEKDGDINALMMSLRQVSPGTVKATLMYMDPEQFKQRADEGTAPV